MTSAKRPNILLICTDQQRYDSLGCYGNHVVQTPTIDRLAAAGVVFEQCYVQSPVCAPSRASLVTGQYVHNHGVWANGVSLPNHATNVSNDLAAAGYHCGMIGKMHLAACFEGRTETRHSDGYAFYKWAHDPSHASPENDYHQWLEKTQPELFEQATSGAGRVRHQPGGFDRLPTEGHYSRWAGTRAIDFLTHEREADAPFFLWVNFYDPHHPFVAPQEYLDRYDPDQMPDPIGVPGELDGKPPIQRDASMQSYAGHARGFADHTAEEMREVMAAYYAMISLIDDETSRILGALDDLGLADDTLVIFTSDHGEMLGDHQLLLKGPMLYEGAVRVPLIMRWPGEFPAGERRANLVQWIDLTATFLDLAGITAGPTIQGSSLLPLARDGHTANWRDWAICEYRNSGHPYDPPVHMTMLRAGHYKLIVQHGAPASSRPRTGELYDLTSDPDELVNLWNVTEAQPIQIELERLLLDVLVATEDRSQAREAFW
jgi:arylsulfatase